MTISIKQYQLLHGFWNIIDWFYPPTCCGCGRVGFRICEDCLSKIQRIENKICVFCGECLPIRGVCDRCKQNPPHFSALRSWGIFSGPLRQAIHSLKYNRNLGLGEFFAQYLLEIVQNEKWLFDIIVAVPLNHERLKERGYNQAEFLAKPLSMLLEKCYLPDSITRTKNTISQVGLSLEERQRNVSDAFMADSEKVRSKSILIIDDVTTTGSTMNSCAKSLRIAGAKTVLGLTLARAIKLADDPIIVR
jgi:competence protein ComFC